jgi:hypothetical protein
MRYDEKNLAKTLLAEIKQAKGKWLKESRLAHEKVLSVLRQCKQYTTIVDIGWGGTIQVLLTELARINGLKVQIDGVYLGANQTDKWVYPPPPIFGYLMNNVHDSNNRALWQAVIWEYAYTQKAQFAGDKQRQNEIVVGFDCGINLWREIKTNPREYYDKLLMPQIKRLINQPTIKEVYALSQLYFDFGFAKSEKCAICNLDLSRKRFWCQLLAKPMNTMREIYRPNSWPAGYRRYYHLGFTKLLLPFYRLFNKVKRK